MAAEPDAHPADWNRLGRVELRDARMPLAWAGLVEARSVDAVITSPPYFTGFDDPEAMRLEGLFAGAGDDVAHRWRSRQMASSAHHASAQRAIDAHRELGQWPRTQGASRVLSGALRKQRLARLIKPYDRILPMYLRDSAHVIGRVRPLLRSGATLAIAVAQSAPAGVAIPVPRLIERLCQESGLVVVEGAEVLRERGQRRRTSPRLAAEADLSEELVVVRRPGSQSSSRGDRSAALAKSGHG
jgi:hypothetical protein